MDGFDMEMLMDTVNHQFLNEIKKGNVDLKEDSEVVIAFLDANLTRHPDMIRIMEAMNTLINPDDSEKEAVIKEFLAEVRNLVNQRY